MHAPSAGARHPQNGRGGACPGEALYRSIPRTRRNDAPCTGTAENSHQDLGVEFHRNLSQRRSVFPSADDHSANSQISEVYIIWRADTGQAPAEDPGQFLAEINTPETERGPGCRGGSLKGGRTSCGGCEAKELPHSTKLIEGLAVSELRLWLLGLQAGRCAIDFKLRRIKKEAPMDGGASCTKWKGGYQ